MNSNDSETLLILQEECSEVSQAISKCFRFGLDGIKPGKARSNREHLEEELGDLLCMIQLLQDSGIVSESALRVAKSAKLEKLRCWSNLNIAK